ncbi:MAG: hypothetical protein PHP70_08035 [Gallionella sp.]|nr:hypothetical protein [Gallionella sp.]
MQIKYLSNTTANPPSLLRKAGTIAVATALAGVALMFSAVLIVAVVSIGAVAFAYLWWKTRALRKQMKAQMRDFPPHGANVQREAFMGEVYEGEVIEGEAVRVEESVSSASVSVNTRS